MTARDTDGAALDAAGAQRRLARCGPTTNLAESQMQEPQPNILPGLKAHGREEGRGTVMPSPNRSGEGPTVNGLSRVAQLRGPDPSHRCSAHFESDHLAHGIGDHLALKSAHRARLAHDASSLAALTRGSRHRPLRAPRVSATHRGGTLRTQARGTHAAARCASARTASRRARCPGHRDVDPSR